MKDSRPPSAPEVMHTPVDKIMARAFSLCAALNDASPAELREVFKHCRHLGNDAAQARLTRRFFEDVALLVRNQTL